MTFSFKNQRRFYGSNGICRDEDWGGLKTAEIGKAHFSTVNSQICTQNGHFGQIIMSCCKGGKYIVANLQLGFNVRLRYLNFTQKLVDTRSLKEHAD